MAPSQPTFSSFATTGTPPVPAYNAAPNYNITLPTSPPLQPTTSASPPPPFFAAQMSMNSVLAPSKPAQPQWPGTAGTTKQLSKDDWGDFDPLA